MRGKNDRNYSNFGYTYDQKRSILFEISNFRSIQVVIPTYIVVFVTTLMTPKSDGQLGSICALR